MAETSKRPPRFKSYEEKLDWILEQQEVARDVLAGRLSPAEKMEWNRWANRLQRQEGVARVGLRAENSGVPYEAIRDAEDAKDVRTLTYKHWADVQTQRNEEARLRVEAKKVELARGESTAQTKRDQVQARNQAIKEEIEAEGRKPTLTEMLKRGYGMNDAQYEASLDAKLDAQAREELTREQGKLDGMAEAWAATEETSNRVS
jgi:hypothetical protein